MGLGRYILTLLGSLVLLVLFAGSALHGVLALGARLNGAVVGLAVVLASLGLLVLWPLVYVCRFAWHKARGSVMPPVRQELVLPGWLTGGVKALVVLACVSMVLFVSLLSVLKLAFLDYVKVAGRTAKLAVVRFRSGMNDGLPVFDVEAEDVFGRKWKIDDQVGELFQADVSVFSCSPAVARLLAEIGMGECARMVSISARSEERDSRPIECLPCGERGFFEGTVALVAPYLAPLGLELSTVHSAPVKPGDGRTSFVLGFDAHGTARLLPCGSGSDAGAGSDASGGTAGKAGGASGSVEQPGVPGAAAPGSAPGSEGRQAPDAGSKNTDARPGNDTGNEPSGNRDAEKGSVDAGDFDDFD